MIGHQWNKNPNKIYIFFNVLQGIATPFFCIFKKETKPALKGGGPYVGCPCDAMNSCPLTSVSVDQVFEPPCKFIPFFEPQVLGQHGGVEKIFELFAELINSHTVFTDPRTSMNK